MDIELIDNGVKAVVSDKEDKFNLIINDVTSKSFTKEEAKEFLEKVIFILENF